MMPTRTTSSSRARIARTPSQGSAHWPIRVDLRPGVREVATAVLMRPISLCPIADPPCARHRARSIAAPALAHIVRHTRARGLAGSVGRMAIVGLDHVQVAAPPGCEGDARRFYSGLLGLAELEKPPELAARGARRRLVRSGRR